MKQEKRICLNRSVLDFMESKLTPESIVLEFGGGWSSKWFADRCGRLTVIETSFKWAKTIQEELAGRGRVIVPRIGLNFLSDIRMVGSDMRGTDLVLIDCAEALRRAATEFAWPLLKPGGWLVFDDAQRARHMQSILWMQQIAGNSTALGWQPGDVEGAESRIALVWQKKAGRRLIHSAVGVVGKPNESP